MSDHAGHDKHANHRKYRESAVHTRVIRLWISDCHYPARMDANRFLPLIPKLEMVAIGLDTLTEAQSRIIACEGCDPDANRPFSAVLDEVTDRMDLAADYILMGAVTCSNCASEITERTLVVFASSAEPGSAMPKYFDPPLEETDIVLIDDPVISEAESFVQACEGCSEEAEFAFDQIVDSITGCDPARTDYIMARNAQCPRCRGGIAEKTLVLPV
jgi:hypothetical protein